jgi:hypothetical protein
MNTCLNICVLVVYSLAILFERIPQTRIIVSTQPQSFQYLVVYQARLCIQMGTSKNPLIGMQRKAQTGAIRRYCEDLQRRDAPEYGVFRSSQIRIRNVYAPYRAISCQ